MTSMITKAFLIESVPLIRAGLNTSQEHAKPEGLLQSVKRTTGIETRAVRSKALHRDEEQKRFQRGQDMVRAGCSCYATLAQQSFHPEKFNAYSSPPSGAPYSSAPSGAPYSDPNLVPCDGKCPIEEYVCGSDNLCHPPSYLRAKTGEVFRSGVEKLNEIVVDNLVEALGESVAAIWNSTLLKIATPTPLDTWSQAYKNSLDRIEADRKTLQANYADLNSVLGGRNPWGSSSAFSTQEWQRIGNTLARIRESKAAFRQHLDGLNAAHQGLQTEQDMGSKVCYNVISLENAQLNAAAAILLALPDSQPVAAP